MATQPSRSSRTGSLYQQLRTAILNGDILPGVALSETAVGEKFGVSRTPVREALQALERDGLLETNGRRLQVKVASLEEIMAIYDCRIVLEGEAARWAATSRTEAELLLLEMALDDMRQAVGLAPMELTSVNHQFHDRLWRMAHNSTLVEILERLNTQILHFPQRTARQPGRWEQSITEHEEILRAVRDQDADRAAAASRAHVTATRDVRLRMLSESRADVEPRQ